MMRSTTVGIPSLRTPPSGLGISFCRTGMGYMCPPEYFEVVPLCVPATTARPVLRSSRRSRCSMVALDHAYKLCSGCSCPESVSAGSLHRLFLFLPQGGTRHFCILFTSTLSICTKPFRYFAVMAPVLLPVCTQTYDCSALPVFFFFGTMASADFLRQALLRRFGFFFLLLRP